MDQERKPMANITPFGLRMQPDLKAAVEQSARENNRSLNAEIVARLEWSLGDTERFTEMGMVAVSRRLEASAQILETLFRGPYDKRIDGLIEEKAAEGIQLSRLQAFHFILDDYFAHRP